MSVRRTQYLSFPFLASMPVLLVLLAGPSHAQPASGSKAQPPSSASSAQTAACGSAVAGQPERLLNGTVSDTQGARITGAAVTVRCGETIIRRERTIGDGGFAVRLPPGTYTVRVETPGFDLWDQAVEMAADRDSQLLVELIVAQVTDAVTVRPATAPTHNVTATKTDTPLLETPQAVSIVTRDRIIEQGASSLQEALNYAAGVRSEAFGMDSRTDNIFVRGSYPDVYLDGLRQQLGGYYTSTTRQDPFLLERVEVLRGPSAMLYGQGSTAGVVNMVTKRPTAAPRREVALQFGSFGRKQIQADVAGPLTSDGHFLYRLVGILRDADTQVDFVKDNRLLIAPSVTWQPSSSTSLTIQMTWQRDRAGSTLQFLPWSGIGLPNPNGKIRTSTFVGDPDIDRYNSTRLTGGYLLEHRFNPRWVVRQNLRLTRNRVDFRSTTPDSFTYPGGGFIDPNQRVMIRFLSAEITKVGLFVLDQNVEGRFRTGFVDHQVLFGVDGLRQRQTGVSLFDLPVEYGGTVTPIDIFSPSYVPYTPPPFSDKPAITQGQLGVYAQDQMHFGPRWIGVVGVRHDNAWNGQEGKESEDSQATSKRVGLMYAAAAGWSPYVSYSETFSPVAGVDRFNTRYKPLRGKQVEGGIKFQPVGKDYTIAAAVFDLRGENFLVSTDPTLPAVQAGKTKATGLELEAQGEVTRSLAIAAHYNYIDNDEQLDTLPSHQTGVWARQRFRIGSLDFAGGLGIRYLSSFKDRTAPVTPSLTLADAMLAWDLAHWRYAVNVTNLTDKVYYSTCLARGDCFFGARRTVVFSAGYRY